MQFMKEFFSGKPAPLLLPKITPQRMPYNLSVTRWHGDIRDAVPVILLHELLGSSRSWSHFVSSVSLLPQLGKTLKTPTSFYAPNLPFHGIASAGVVGGTPSATSSSSSASREHSSGSWFLDAAADVVHFQQTVLGGPCHLVGVGVGAEVAAVAALAMPQQALSSLTLLSADGDIFGEQGDSSAEVASYQAAMAKIQLLLDSLATTKSSSLLQLETALRRSVPNPAERTALLHNVEEVGDGSLRVRSDVASLFQQYPHRSVQQDDTLKKALSSSVLDTHTIPVTVCHAKKTQPLSGQPLFDHCFPKATFCAVPSISLEPAHEEEMTQLLQAVLEAQKLLASHEQAQAEQ